ncbi:TonB-dependent receptor [Stenotrophobium rhamnosiphilum]|uniref:TonB-dependent receptor n=1 Tax=Stenotrophobium rhamnosiphilum TaxID=2029166 RepID=A0A2T5MKK0_9GAMM|nr:TonB-dependent receptor [Stenotrophobium rhamnosiphilum]PTU33107.1 TonB-dependent receptor [Stenotrophobium rhamnosiphilum]
MSKITRIIVGSRGLSVVGYCLVLALTTFQVSAQDNQQAEQNASPAPAQSFDDGLLNDIINSGDTSAPEDTIAQPSADVLPSNDNAAVVDLPNIPVVSEQAGASVADAPVGNSRQIEEIVVTATKREESIRDIPASISAFSGADLENQGKLNLNDFIQQSPGVVASQQGSGFTRISMRGISTDTNPTSTNPATVGIFIGDTAFTDPYINGITPDLSAFDLSGVQVLKGPQGTLFGGAALSGAVRYELQDPVVGEWQFRGFSLYTSPDQGTSAFTNGAAINVPILKDDGLALRFAYIKRNTPGLYANTRTNPPERGVDEGEGDQIRAILLWTPSEDWKFKLTHLTQNFSAPNATSSADSPNGPRESDKFILDQPLKNKFGLDSFEVNYNFDSMRVVSLSSFISKDLFVSNDLTPIITGSPPQGYPQELGLFLAVNDDSRAFSQELRLQSTGDGPFKWLVGGYFYNYKLDFNMLGDTVLHQNISANDLLNSLPGVLGSIVDFTTQTTSLLYAVNKAKSQERAFFTDLTYTLWDDLDLSAGARFYSTSVSGGFVGTGVLVLASNNLMPVDLTSRIAEHGINPKFSATYRFSEDISLYGLASKGFRFGGLQQVPSTATNGVPATYKSDSLWNYELGLRTSWLDQTLQADITGFYIKYKDPIIQQATQGIPLNYYVNVSSAVSKGFEANFLWNPPVDGLTVSASGGLTDAYITAPFTAVGGVEVKSGAQMPGAARSQYNASIRYMKPLWFVLAGVDVGYNYIGKGFSNVTHDIPINDFGTLNAGLSLMGGSETSRLRLNFNIVNILNETVPVTGSISTALNQITKINQYVLNQPRTFTIRLGLDL